MTKTVHLVAGPEQPPSQIDRFVAEHERRVEGNDGRIVADQNPQRRKIVRKFLRVIGIKNAAFGFPVAEFEVRPITGNVGAYLSP